MSDFVGLEELIEVVRLVFWRRVSCREGSLKGNVFGGFCWFFSCVSFDDIEKLVEVIVMSL